MYVRTMYVRYVALLVWSYPCGICLSNTWKTLGLHNYVVHESKIYVSDRFLTMGKLTRNTR